MENFSTIEVYLSVSCPFFFMKSEAVFFLQLFQEVLFIQEP